MAVKGLRNFDILWTFDIYKDCVYKDNLFDLRARHLCYSAALFIFRKPWPYFYVHVPNEYVNLNTGVFSSPDLSEIIEI